MTSLPPGWVEALLADIAAGLDLTCLVLRGRRGRRRGGRGGWGGRRHGGGAEQCGYKDKGESSAHKTYPTQARGAVKAAPALASRRRGAYGPRRFVLGGPPLRRGPVAQW